MVATNAFGMGIVNRMCGTSSIIICRKTWKAIIRRPDEQAGTAFPAECILLYAGQDVITNQFFIENMAQESEDPETTALIRQREEERLKKRRFTVSPMSASEIIPAVFRGIRSNYCGNCSNCLSEFETVDVTAAAKAILGCVRECRQRYGHDGDSRYPARCEYRENPPVPHG